MNILMKPRIKRYNPSKEIPLEKCRVIVDSTVMAIRNNQKLNTGIYIKNNTGYLVDVVLKAII